MRYIVRAGYEDPKFGMVEFLYEEVDDLVEAHNLMWAVWQDHPDAWFSYEEDYASVTQR